MATASSSVFIYKGVDKKGAKVQGEMSGASTALVKTQLRKQGIITRSVRKKPKSLFGGGGKPITPMDISIFTRQMATMMKAGVPLVQSFEIVAEGVDNPNLRDLIMGIHSEVASGTSFALALSSKPQYFDELFCNLVESGEQSGALETMLDRVATYKEKTEALKAKIKKAMNYPIAVLCIALVVTGILLVKVVPQFASTFSSFGAELPAFTLFYLGISDFVIEWWLIILLGIGISVASLKEAIKRSPAFADQMDAVLLKLPVVGDIIYHSVLARFSRTLATTFSAGVPLIDALESVAGAAGNAVYKKAILSVRDEVATGIALNASLRKTGVFPSMLLQMTAIGEESGALDEMLDKVAGFYEDAVDNMVDGMTALLEPIIMSILGVVIGSLMIAMYLPIFQLGAVV